MNNFEITYTILLSLIKNCNELDDLLKITSLGKGVIDVGKFEKLHNTQAILRVVFKCLISKKRLIKFMRSYFLPKD